jgi:hypothetical protein
MLQRLTQKAECQYGEQPLPQRLKRGSPNWASNPDRSAELHRIVSLMVFLKAPSMTDVLNLDLYYWPDTSPWSACADYCVISVLGA